MARIPMAKVMRRVITGLIILALAALVILFLFAYRFRDSSEIAARRTGNILDKRMEILGSYMRMSLAENLDEWPLLEGLPSDMVVYRYVSDTLQSWCHEFTIDNDDISRKFLEQRFVGQASSIESPLSDVDSVVRYMNLGPKWYLTYCIEGTGDKSECKVIGALEVKNNLAGTYNSVNPRLHLPERFALYPISYTGGAPVYIKGQPLLKVLRENLGNLSFGEGLFSPMIYADGTFLFSLGTLLIINTIILLFILVIYRMRGRLWRFLRKGRVNVRMALFSVVLVLSILLLGFYIHTTFRSIILNSNITLELYKIPLLTRFTFYVYVSFILLLLALGLLVDLGRYPLGYYHLASYSLFSRNSRTIFSILCALYLVSVSSILGGKREQNRVEIWANRLAIDRDLGFELQLRTVERGIADDPVIRSLVDANRDYRTILNRITENYMARISQDYDIDIYVARDKDSDPNVLRYFNERLQGAVAIAESSHFMYSRTVSGKAQYTGVFIFYSPQTGVSRLLLALDSKAERGGRGFASIVPSSSPSSVRLPSRYSSARYLNDKLVGYNGDYPYPTVLEGRLKKASAEGDDHMVSGGYVHFVNHVSDTESVVISRPRIDATQYSVAAFVIFLVLFILLSIRPVLKERRGVFGRNYYKARINTVLYLSLFATLVVMAAISVLFVYRRNVSNVNNLVTAKITTIQSILGSGCRYFNSYEDFNQGGQNYSLEEIAEFTNTDITLYAPTGKVFLSTYPDMYQNLAVGSRMNEEAFRRIVKNHSRYFIHREKISGRGYYAMYCPLFNEGGKLLSIVCAPYTEANIDFRSEALFHSIFIITAFLLLLIVARGVASKVVERLFGPLGEMGKKMYSARTEGLEYIFYERDDEIASLVRAYNLMVHDLSESSKQAAQVERDKAWSEMARQVAHEIKNPLTPIKLQIQRIIRLKNKKDPGWEDKLDSIVPVIMDSIETLTETANEFSTFAKLYSQESVLIDLDAMAKDEVALYDGKDNITIQYMGLENAMIMGPKPQLTRVFVNLLANAVQAIENQQAEDREEGREPKPGQILLSIRNSNRDGFYDIVVEDNGPGVKDENRSRLFTPNFTTKSSGTGLGLAICKNILERCGGDISYSRSFTLQGACFTVRYPKYGGGLS